MNVIEQWVMDHEPVDADHWYLKGEALDEFGQHEAAMTAFERACALGDELPYNWLIPSTVSHLCAHKRYTEALPFFVRAMEHDPTDMEICMWYGRILAELGRREETLKVYQQVAERQPDYARAWHDQGHILRQLGRHEEAVAAYQKAVELEPQYVTAWNNLGMSLNDLKRYEEALTAFRRANILKPNEAWYLYNMAWALDNLNRSEEALPLLDRAIELDSTHVQSWRLKGKIFHKLERFAESIATADVPSGLLAPQDRRAPETRRSGYRHRAEDRTLDNLLILTVAHVYRGEGDVAEPYALAARDEAQRRGVCESGARHSIIYCELVDLALADVRQAQGRFAESGGILADLIDTAIRPNAMWAFAAWPFFLSGDYDRVRTLLNQLDRVSQWARQTEMTPK